MPEAQPTQTVANSIDQSMRTVKRILQMFQTLEAEDQEYVLSKLQKAQKTQ